MPPLETTDCRQKAVYWEKTGDNRRGQTIVSPTAVEIKVRWNNKQRQVLKPDGTVITVMGDVVTNFPIVVGSVIWEGGLDDIPGTAEVPESDLMEVVTSNVTSDIKNRNKRYEATFIRYNDRLPVT